MEGEVIPGPDHHDEALILYEDPAPPISPPQLPAHSVNLGDLLKVAYNDPQMTVEEDFGLGLNQSVLKKRAVSCETDAISTSNDPLPDTCAPTKTDNEINPLQSAQSAKNRKRAEKRRKRAENAPPSDRIASERTRREHVQLSEPIPVASTFTVNDMPAMNGAYKARNEEDDPEALSHFNSLEEFRQQHPDFHLIQWNGIDATPILDSNQKIGAVLCGQPDNAGYREATDEALRVMLEATDSTRFRQKEQIHRRGGFPAINIGVTYGLGHEEPQFLKTDPYTAMLQNILSNKSIQRLASYGSRTFQLWQPKVYQYYAERLEKLWAHRPDLTCIFGKRSVYPCAAFNFSRNVWCYKHRDVMNCPFGFCSITALGNFDATKGGHLILWEFKMIVEFPHGSTILVPSATVTHSNIPVQDGDTRLSFTQFCAGGLFQYVDNGFATEARIKDSDPEKYRKIQQNKPLNWKAGLDLIASMDDVKFT